MRNSIFSFFIAVLIVCGCNKIDKRTESTASQDYEAAVKYYYTNRDSSYYLFHRVIEKSHDTVEKAQAYNIVGLQQLEAGDYYGAQESLLSSIKILDEKDTGNYRSISSTYNTLANATLELKEYDSAINYYQLSLNFAPNENLKLYAVNGLALTYQKQKKFKTSIAVYDSVIAQPISDTSVKAMLISNYARTKWLADPSYIALPEFITALELRRAANNMLGMNASFAHLTDYYTDTRPDSALYYGLKRLEIAQTFYDPTDRVEVLRQLMILDAPKRKEYAIQCFRLEDSLNIVRIKNRGQFATIRFGVEKSKAENLSLQQHISKQRLLLYGLIVLAILIIAGLWSWYQKRRKRQKEEAEREIRESKLKTSQKVHDVVANGLYTIINELEHNENVEKEPLLTRIEGLYEKSRNISYEDAPAEQANYDIQVHQLLTSFANEQTKVIMVGNQEAFWSRITTVQKKELLLILNEMMVNMKKHSGAKNVVVVFKQENGKGFIHYKDDGAGFPAGFEFGNGLDNTVSRIKSLSGEINFGKSEKNGVSITLSFPLEANKS